MARKIIWTLEAADDIESIATYIARDSHFYAKSFVREIINASLSLKEFPEVYFYFINLKFLQFCF